MREKRRQSCIVWIIIIGAIPVLFLAWQYVDYRLEIRTLPADMTVGGLSVEGMTRRQALNALEVAFATPLEVAYHDQRLTLPPDMVDLRYDMDGTADNLDDALAPRRGLSGFVSHLLRRSGDPIDVPVAVTYSEQKLDRFLTRIADRYDRAPMEPVALPDSLTFRIGKPGFRLDVDASRARLVAALTSAATHQVALVVETEPASDLEPALLMTMLHSILEDHEGLVTGVFVKDLASGDELAINAEVAYNGMGVLKVAVLAEIYRALDEAPDVETLQLISETITADDDSAANVLLRDVIDEGDSHQGADLLTASLQRLGLKNTFMTAPYGVDTASTVVTPANARADVDTDPDDTMQTTPLDMGLFLEMIYQCDRGGGALLVAHADDLTSDACREMIEWMSENRIDSLIEVGVPADTQVAHKEGLTADTHADVGLVFSSGGDFVLSVFLHRPDWLPWEESAPLIADIATATYNYFNPD